MDSRIEYFLCGLLIAIWCFIGLSCGVLTLCIIVERGTYNLGTDIFALGLCTFPIMPFVGVEWIKRIVRIEIENNHFKEKEALKK